jgi:hypothetical protein
LKRYGVRSNTIRIGDGRAKGYQVAGDDGLAQAWHRYLPTISTRDTRDNGDIAGQCVTPTVQSRDSRDAAVTREIPSDQALFDDDTDVTDVTATDGLVHNGHRVTEVCCRACGDPMPEHMRSARAREVCTDCTAGASKAEGFSE